MVELDGDVVAEEGLNKWGDGWRFVAVNVRMILGLAMVCGGVSAAEPLVVDDAELLRVMCGELGKMAESGEAVTGKALAEMLEKAPREVEVELPARVPETKGYEDLARSVFMLGSVYDCGKCDQWHSNGNATAWCLTPDGVMVTNHHVFQSRRGDAWGVCGVDGKVYRVTEILAADGDADVAIFRVDVGEDALRPLALGGDAGVGDGVRIVSHPDGRNFFQTSGEVGRYHRVPPREGAGEKTWMSVTADYAKGSSGGPVVNEAGKVVGMVSNTQSIYYGPRGKDGDQQGPLQMVVKNCVPVKAVRVMIKAREGAASRR